MINKMTSLKAYVTSSEPWQRKRALEEMVERAPDDRRTATAMIAALSDSDAGVRRFSTFHLAELTDERVPEAIVGKLSDADPKVRIAAIQSLAYLNYRPAIDQLVNAMYDSNPQVRRMAIWKLKGFKNPALAPFVVGAMDVHDADAQETARCKYEVAAGLMWWGSKGRGAVPRLIAELKSSTNDHLREQIIETLGKIGDRRAAAILADVLFYDTNRINRGYAARALGAIGGKEAVSALTRFVKNEFSNKWYAFAVREAVRALGKLDALPWWMSALDG